ncbi:MAG: alpha/beta fold hydrolase, partial [Bacteroidota bacterium]
ILLFLLLIVQLSSLQTAAAQDILGRWYSKVQLDTQEVHYLFDIRKNAATYAGYLDLPSIGNFRIPLDSVGFAGEQAVFSHNSLAMRFSGKLDPLKDEIAGYLTNDQRTYPLTLSRHPQAKRSQTIELPLSYQQEEVYFYNKDSIRFAGTLTLPRDVASPPVVVLISGSGPQNRDSEILGHKPFAVLADYLSRRGVAVLRYDDRGYGASQGQFRPATSKDYAFDALGAVQFLKNYPNKTFSKIGLAGHSEGGNIAPVVATMDSSVQFLILLAAPGTSNFYSYLVSLDLVLKDYPETYDRDFPFFKSVYEDMAYISDKATLKDSLQSKFERIAKLMAEEEFTIYGGKEGYIASQVGYHTSDWYHYYLQFDMTDYLMQLDIPILALNGNRDISVEAIFNLNGIAQTLTKAGNQQFETVILKDVNHFFQSSKDDKIESVYFNEETFSKVALEKMIQWIRGL